MLIQSQLDAAVKSSSLIRDQLARIDAEITSSSAKKSINTTAKAFIYIWLAATLEKYFKDSLAALIREISEKSLSANELKPSLFAIYFDSELTSVSSSRKLKSWNKRAEMFLSLESNSSLDQFPETVPSDGKTIRPVNFETAWKVFGFPNESMPSILHKSALIDLADGRNELAHGGMSPDVFGMSKTVKDLRNLVNRCDDILIHLAVTIDEYASSESYKI